eukprot:TRINITY_DN4379_c0_g2_i2.p2 TRINITY_DN4379_c0_g2~~TRINITY_DN4379_c0_g2_i2.p2  ORF type:complete len:126 (-),score=24.15 TRINITY_DN4379_c0_g2_i2:475-852(-)
MKVLRMRISNSRTLNPIWNENLVLLVAKPFEEQLILSVEHRPGYGGNKDSEILGQARVAITTTERRVDDHLISSKWINLEPMKEEASKGAYHGRIHLRLCFDGGYHVMDEVAPLCSELRATAKQL